ncbi:hypothetical protein [Paucibacter soli]|uniref:hypothetical protein n=1 Tax=Paucibacter soli TaxID=3133433 RepID=UPI0030A791BD
MGYMIGQKASSNEEAAQGYKDDLQAMRDELKKAIAGGLYDKAFAQAAADVVTEIVDEEAAIQAGKTRTRRLSDPGNSDARNSAYIEHAAENVNRLSGGKLRMSADTRAKLKAQRPIK